LHGAGALDVTPTILSWFGLPIGDDMEGRVLVEGFIEMPEIRRVASWETEPRAALTDDTTESNPVARNLQQETRWNRVQSSMEAGRFEAALPDLQSLFRGMPERPEFSHALFQCQLTLGRLTEAEQTLEVLLESVPPGPLAWLPQAELALAKRDLRSARRLAGEIGKARPSNPAVLRRLGLLLLRLREWTALEELARSAIALDESDPIAWLGLAEASLRRQKPAEAENAARRAIQLKYFLPDAHFVLARALVAQNKWNDAREVMSATMALQPGNKAAVEYHRRLAEE
jgi:predicted Zn-dependent protease